VHALPSVHLHVYVVAFDRQQVCVVGSRVWGGLTMNSCCTLLNGLQVCCAGPSAGGRLLPICGKVGWWGFRGAADRPQHAVGAGAADLAPVLVLAAH
jgi:hypothetical protein